MIEADNKQWAIDMDMDGEQLRYLPTGRDHVEFDRVEGNFIVWDETEGELCRKDTFAEACKVMVSYANFLTTGKEPESYAEFVASRFKSGEDTARDLALCSGKEAQMLHAAAGMAGEWFEYKTSGNRKNMLEELGDFLFFYTAGAQVLGIEDLQSVAAMPVQAGVLDYSMACHRLESGLSEILDIAKKPAIYRKNVHFGEHDASAYRGVFLAFRTVLEHHGFTLAELEETNRAKLTKRYEKGYSNEAAQARADKVE